MTNHDAPLTPHQAPETHRFVTVAEAVRILGLSATTIRRKIDAGELEAERVTRPQGTVFLVKVPMEEPRTLHDEPVTHGHETATPQDAPGGPDRLAAIVVPLVAQIDALRQSNERQAAEIGELREDRGRLAVALEHAQQRITSLEARAEPAPAEVSTTAPTPSAPLWVRLRLILAVLAVALVLAGALLFVPR
jgi:excisionase family DNA binding protein